MTTRTPESQIPDCRRRDRRAYRGDRARAAGFERHGAGALGLPGRERSRHPAWAECDAAPRAARPVGGDRAGRVQAGGDLHLRWAFGQAPRRDSRSAPTPRRATAHPISRSTAPTSTRRFMPPARRLQAVTLSPGFDLTGVEEIDASVNAIAADGRIAEAPALIGADGIWSEIRKLIAPHARLLFTGATAWRTLLPRGELTAPLRRAGRLDMARARHASRALPGARRQRSSMSSPSRKEAPTRAAGTRPAMPRP